MFHMLKKLQKDYFIILKYIFYFHCLLQLARLPLKELYCEENNLLQHIPVHSEQEDEVLTLKVGTNVFVAFPTFGSSSRVSPESRKGRTST